MSPTPVAQLLAEHTGPPARLKTWIQLLPLPSVLPPLLCLLNIVDLSWLSSLLRVPEARQKATGPPERERHPTSGLAKSAKHSAHPSCMASSFSSTVQAHLHNHCSPSSQRKAHNVSCRQWDTKVPSPYLPPVFSLQNCGEAPSGAKM